MDHNNKGDRITLSLYPNDRGFGYAVCRGINTVCYWGTKRSTGDKNKVCARKFVQLLNQYRPKDVVLEDIPKEQEPRRPRVADLIISLAQISMAQGCTVHFYSRAQIRDAFQTHNAFTKQEIAEAIGAIVPELKKQIPPKRRLWETEPMAMAYFSAASLALTHFHFDQNEQS